MPKSVLVDVTRCIGCGACTVACKLWNGLVYDEQVPHSGSKAQLNERNWTILEKRQVNGSQRRYVKKQCMHCLEPACVSDCFFKALQRDESGAVIYHPELCVGCRYCMVACPFEVPKYEWGKQIPLVAKCQFCSSKLAAGEAPACTGACPTQALLYGERSELLAEAHRRLQNGSYVPQVYGEKEIGGTSWLYLSDVPFAQLGFPEKLGEKSLPAYTQGFLSQTPWLAVGWGGFLAGMSWYTRRRRRLKDEDKEGGEEDES